MIGRIINVVENTERGIWSALVLMPNQDWILMKIDRPEIKEKAIFQDRLLNIEHTDDYTIQSIHCQS